MTSIAPDSPWRGAAAFLRQPLSQTDRLAAQNLVEMIYYYNVCNADEPLSDIEYRSSDGELDTRRHVFRWDSTPHDLVFENGFVARRQTGTPDSTYFSLERYVNNGGRPLDSRRETTYAFISTTLSSQWYPRVDSGQTIRVYRYEIYAPGGIWVAETLGNRYRFSSQDEVAFPAGIAPQYIRSAQLFILTGDRQYTRRIRADTFLYINTNFNPQSHPQSQVRIQRPVRDYRDAGNRVRELTIIEYPDRSRVKRAGVVCNDVIDYYIYKVTEIDIYIDSAFCSSLSMGYYEAFMFFKDEYVRINYAPSSTDDYVINGPLLIGNGFIPLASTGFAEYGIDAAFRSSYSTSEAFVFSGNLCAKIKFAPDSTGDKILEGPKTIRQMFPSFRGTNFEKGIDAAFESTSSDEAFLFKGSEYARINYTKRTLLAKSSIVDGFNCFRGTKFSSDIGAAFGSNYTNDAYLFKDNNYVLLHFTPGKSSDYIVGGPKEIVPINWPSLKNILPRKNRGLDVYETAKPSPLRDHDEL